MLIKRANIKNIPFKYESFLDKATLLFKNKYINSKKANFPLQSRGKFRCNYLT